VALGVAITAAEAMLAETAESSDSIGYWATPAVIGEFATAIAVAQDVYVLWIRAD